MQPVPEKYAHLDAYWAAYLGTTIALFLRDKHDKRVLQAALRAYLKSPVADDAMRRKLTH